MGKIRGNNSSPGVYTSFTDISYAAKTLGITTLGLVGETQIGPAFEPIKIATWDAFVRYFGGTSTEKFKDSQYPKYELPYIAKSYLTKSDQLYVCRVLGLSGYNAGPAFVIYGKNDDGTENHVIAVLRSRGKYKKYANVGTVCKPISNYDVLEYDCDSITLNTYTTISTAINCTEDSEEWNVTTGSTSFAVSSTNYGQFCIQPMKGGKNVGNPIPVSLNPGTKDYIYNVLGSTPDTNSSIPVYVEELYDLNHQKLVDENRVKMISQAVKVISELSATTIDNDVDGIVTVPTEHLSSKNLNKVYLCTEDFSDEEGQELYKAWNKNGESWAYGFCVAGCLYEVKPDKANNGYGYYQKMASADVKSLYTSETLINKNEPLKLSPISNNAGTSVNVSSNQTTYLMPNAATIAPSTDKNVVSLSFANYKEGFRSAVTPWIVSELKGNGNGTDFLVCKMFRFYTITDGSSANNYVKISISNIRPEEGTFDVIVRDFYDSDNNITVLESFKNLTMVPGTSHYIGLKIGTLDGSYELKSKYIIVEIADDEKVETSVPCGFLGYPIRTFPKTNDGKDLTAPSFTYNTIYNEDVKAKRQYFGLSDITGVDVDMLSYKGKDAYHENDYTYGYTKPFHLDSTLSPDIKDMLKKSGKDINVTIDGIPATSSITWDTVSPKNTGKNGTRPIIGLEYEMEGTIYEDKNLRKFTVCFYGGFDGWDIYRGSRTNTDDFKANKYKGTISNGQGRTFSKVTNSEVLSLPSNSITSDYYAYLAGYNQFENPDRYIINLFATPGIDYVNNTLLTNEVLEMLEEKRGDSLYVPTTPDKPFGASDAEDEMYTAADASENLEDTSIDTYFATTYYPWVNYYDSANFKYLNLPATKDVVRNMADVDNKKYPWYAPAGLERGNVECRKAHLFTKIEDENEIYDGLINPIKTFGEDGVKVWGNKTMYTGDTPMNRVNVVRLMLYMRKLIKKAVLNLIFEPNETTLKQQFESIIKPILAQIKADRGITDYRLKASQTQEQMDAHELSANIGVKPTPTLEYIEINFTITPQGVEFDDVM